MILPPPSRIFLRAARYLAGLVSLGLVLVATATDAIDASSNTPPPTPYFRKYGSTDGMPRGTIYAIAKAPAGGLWLATQSGLFQFNGNGFIAPDIDARSAAGAALRTEISALYIDHAGVIWSGTRAGLVRYDPERKEARLWQHDPHDPRSLQAGPIYGLAETSDGGLWIATFSGGLSRWSAQRPGFEHIPLRRAGAAGLVSNQLTILLGGEDGVLWIGSIDQGLARRAADGGITQIHFDGLSQGPRIYRAQAYDGGLLVATDQGAYQVAGDTAERLRPAVLPAHRVFSTTHDRAGGLWLGSDNGLDYLDPQGHYHRFSEHAYDPGSLAGNFILDIVPDREGGLWFNNWEAGLAYLPPDWRNFSSIRHIPDQTTSLADSRIRYLSMAAAGHLLALGENNRLDDIDLQGGTIEHLGLPKAWHDRRINVALRDDKGRLWLGHREGLSLIDGDRVVDVLKTHAGVVHITQTSDGDIYVPTSVQGIYRIDSVSLRSQALQLGQGAEPVRIQQIEDDGHNGLWLLGHDGLYHLHAGEPRFDLVSGVTTTAHRQFAQAPDGALWLTTEHVLERYKLQDDNAVLMQTFGLAEGWDASGDLILFRFDLGGGLWGIGATGLIHYDPVQHRLRRFSKRDGLASDQFSSIYPSLLRMPDGNIYAASNDGGVIGFDPRRVTDTRLPAPAVILTGVQVRRHDTLIPLDIHAGRLTLAWSDRDLRIQVSALSFVDPPSNRYQFLLKGFDTDWVDRVGGEREFSELAPGDYRLLVRATNRGGHWTELATPLEIQIIAPPWERTWALLIYALASILILLGLLLIWRRRLGQWQRMQLAEAANTAKTRFLATMGHEIRTPMTGVLGMTELLLQTTMQAQQRGYAEAIQRSGTLLLKLVNDLLDLARIEAGRMELEAHSFDPIALLHEVALLEGPMATSKGLSLHVLVPTDMPVAVVGDVVRIKQIILNLTHNALKFTAHGGVTLSLNGDQAVAGASVSLIYSVADTGPGIAERSRERLFQRFEQGGSQHAGSGLGLAICRELVGMMGGRIEVSSVLGEGSLFQVYLDLPAAPPCVPLAAIAADIGDRSERLLLVEDDETVAQVILDLLRQRGYTVDHVTHGLAALAALDVGQHDALLLDLDLPGIDGFQVARLWRQRERRRIPILAITARSESNDELLAGHADIDDFLRKPLTGQQLEQAIRQLFDTSTATPITARPSPYAVLGPTSGLAGQPRMPS